MKIVDLHCDTISELLKRKRKGEEGSLRRNGGHLDLERMKDSGYLLQNFALFVDKGSDADPWEEVLAQLSLFYEEMERNKDIILPAGCYEDIAENQEQGKMSGLLMVEEGAVCGGDVRKLRRLYDKGVRMMTLTWNYVNELGYPNLERELGIKAWKLHRELKEKKSRGIKGDELWKLQEEADRVLYGYLNTPDTGHGLTEKGREFVAVMEEMGMLVDVSHLSDGGFMDVLEITSRPFAASHSNAREVCPCVRNLTDDMIRRLAERGGVMGLNFCADFLSQKPAGVSNPGRIRDVVEHAKHIIKVGGSECLGLGSDFDGIDTHEELTGAEKMGVLWDALEEAGLRPSQIDRIFSGNVLRLFREVLS